jgi:hypothetical protein
MQLVILDHDTSFENMRLSIKIHAYKVSVVFHLKNVVNTYFNYNIVVTLNFHYI